MCPASLWTTMKKQNNIDLWHYHIDYVSPHIKNSTILSLGLDNQTLQHIHNHKSMSHRISSKQIIKSNHTLFIA